MANATPFYTRSPKTIVVYPINGQTEFTIPFEFLARKFVVVTLLGVDRLPLVLNTDYRFVSVNRIQLLSPVPAGYPNIELRRLTSATDRLVDFHDGSILRAYDLNLAQIQTMHVAEEARDLTSDTLGVNDKGDLDARNRKIVNLANGEDPFDAVNLGQLRQFDTSTANNADRAEAAKNRAVQAETNTARDSASAAVNATKAVASAGTAVQAASDASRSKAAAEAAESHVVPLVPIVDQAAKDAAEAAANAAQAVQDVKDLGAVPIGSIFPFVKNPPAGYLTCDGSTFSKDDYPDLYAYLGTNVLPDMRGRYLKMSEDLVDICQKHPAIIPTLLHDVDISHTHTASQVAHSHGGTATGGEHFHHSVYPTAPYAYVVAANNYPLSGSYNNGTSGWSVPNQVAGSGGHTHSIATDSVAPAITVNAITNAIRQTTNMRLQTPNPNIQIGNVLEVNHITVVYAIKAAGKVADEGLAQLDGVIQKNIEQDARLDALATTQVMTGGTIKAINTKGISLNGNTYSFVTSTNDAHLCYNSYWDGTGWYKYDVSRPSAYIVLNSQDGGAPHVMYSGAGDTNPNQRQGKLYSTMTPPTFGWRLVRGGENGAWSKGQNVNFERDMRNKLIMFEVSHLGGGSTGIGHTSDGSAPSYWTYGSWEYQMRWVDSQTLNMFYVSDNGPSAIYRVWIWDILD